MTLSLRKPADPVNEALREGVEGPPKLDDTIAALIQKTSNIHAGYLFYPCGKAALQKLCQCLSATKSSPHYKGWEDFGICLGLDQLQIKCILLRFNIEDPTWYTLRAFVEKNDSTMDRIISTLKHMERFDIIMKVHDLFIQLVDEVNRSHPVSSDTESGYYPLTTRDGGGDTAQERKRLSVMQLAPWVPVPLVLQQVNTIVEGVINENRTFTSITNRVKQNESCQRSESYGQMKEPAKKVQYGKTVMLTFAADGLNIAREVAKIFRHEDKQERIGVLILNDHVGKVNANPDAFIFSAFEQVDYVIPIITEGYLQAISTSTCPDESSLLCVDPKYVKYIYTLMSNNFRRNGCINYKVRCLIPDSMLHLTCRPSLMCEPLFQAWVKQSETENLKQRLLKANF